MMNKIQVTVYGDFHMYRKQFNAFVKEVKQAQKESPFIYNVITPSFSAGTMEHLYFDDSEIEAILAQSHNRTEPRVYSDKILGGKPYPQRVNVFKEISRAILRRKLKVLNRSTAIDRFNKLSAMPVFSQKTGLTGAFFNKTIKESLKQPN